MSSNSRDWSALASHNERVVTAAASLPDPDPRPPGRARLPGLFRAQVAAAAAEARWSDRYRSTRVTA